MKHIFEAITQRLDTIPGIKWVDEDKGQMNFERPPVLFPAALVDIQLQKADDLNTKIQTCQALVTIRLAFDFTGSTNTKAPASAREKSLAYYDLVEEVHKALQGWGTQEFNPLSRRQLIQEKRPDGYKVVAMPFSTYYRDVSAANAN